MAKTPLLVTGIWYPRLQSILEPRFEYFVLREQKDPEAFLSKKGSAFRAVLSAPGKPVGKPLVGKLPNLELVVAHSVGVDHVDIPLLKSRGIRLTNTPDVLTDAGAEAAVGLLLACMRKVCVADRYVRDGRWSKDTFFGPTAQLSNKRVGIIGLGRIGASAAKRVECFGCSIAYWGRSEKRQFPSYKFYPNVVDLARHSDAVIVACALTEETTKVVGRDVLDALGPKGYLVNIARGAVVDEEELVKALVEGRIAGAGLDVYVNEPHVPKELLDLDNVVLQPHVSCNTVETLASIGDLVLANLEAHFDGKPLKTPFY